MPTVVDTVVLHYFLVVDRVELLLDLLDPPVGVPRIVFDPNDTQGIDVVVSELRQNIRYEERVANEAVPDDRDDLTRELHDAQANAATKAERLRQIEDMVADGRIELLELTDDERKLSDQLTSRKPDSSFGLLVALDDGEAACVAIAVERGWTLATDDGDALRVLDRIAPGHPYERIRRLLVRAVTDGLTAEADANEVHGEMTRAGFWDAVLPFPDVDEQ
jgi:predicted nucleic acid-binding protein